MHFAQFDEIQIVVATKNLQNMYFSSLKVLKKKIVGIRSSNKQVDFFFSMESYNFDYPENFMSILRPWPIFVFVVCVNKRDPYLLLIAKANL